MSTINVTRHHQLDHDHAKQTADNLAKSLAAEFDVHYQWDGDVLHFKRRGAKGFLKVEPNIIHVELEISFLLTPFRDRIEREIHNHLDGLLEMG